MSANKTHLGFVFLEVFSWEGGIQSYIKDVLTAYLGQPAAPPADIFVLRDGRNSENPFAGDKLTFHNLASSNAMVGRLRLTAGLTKNLVAQRYHHVICGHILLAQLVGPLCRSLGVPYTVMVYGKEVWSPVPPRQRRALQQATGIWANSRHSRDVACAANDLDPTRFHMLPCIVNGDVFTPGEKSTRPIEQYGLHDSRILMTVARLWPGDIYKGVDVTIRALPEILQVFPDVKYLVIGRGDDQPRLAQLAQDMGVGDRVVFAGFVPDEDLVDHYRLADAYVMPSKEGFGIVYLEAMACGVPVLSGDNDGSADPLQDGRVGWRVPHRDPQAVAQACIEILKGEDMRCQGDWLREQTLAHFSPASLQKEVGRLLSTF
ncbi:MAG: glycosyltransferase family 4 protein [Cyanobacteria bacterium P01_F01_bin.86]